MRPLRLRLQAFGSYGGELWIDFARLGRHGIFAISGPTGAGKSTIFDAMVYALYDDLPGFRVDGSIRSQYADASTPTEVCLEFEVHGEQWRVERSPTQPTARRRGGGDPVMKTSTVVLSLLGSDGGGWSRKNQVAEKVEELVGLTKAQFEQVVLIPQGRFEEVLKADTKDRAPLLRRLFPVEIFTGVTEALRSIVAARRETFETATRHHAELVGRTREALQRILGQLPGTVPSPFGDDELTPEGFDAGRIHEHVARVETVLSRVEGLVKAADAAVERARTEHHAAVEAAGRWDEWQANLADAKTFPRQEEQDAAERTALDRVVTLQTLATALDGWKAAAERLADLRSERTGLRKGVEAGWIEGYDREDLEDPERARALAARVDRDAEALERADGEFRRLNEEESELVDLRRRLEERSGDLEAAHGALGGRATALVVAKAEIEKLREQAQGADALAITVGALEGELARVSAREEAGRELARIDAGLTNARDDARRLGAEAARVRLAWRHGLAGRLAQELADGEPCPTCGALDHPAPASVSDGAPDDAALEAAEAAAREADERVQELDGQRGLQLGQQIALAETRGRVVVEADLDAHRRRLGQAEEAKGRLGELVASVEEETAALEADRATLETTARELGADQGALSSRSAAFDADRARFVAAHGHFASTATAAAARKSLAGRVRALHDVLVRLDMEQLAHDQLHGALEPTVVEFGADGPAALLAWQLPGDEIEARGEAWERRRDHRKEVLAKITEYEKSGACRARPDAGPLEAALATAAERHHDLVGRLAIIQRESTELAGMPARLAEAGDVVTTSRAGFEQARTIADLCAGAGAGPVRNRLSLENWVLADYLRQVLRQANGRLATMTGGRYALQLGEGQTDGRKQWGLELDAFDVNTGQTRPVRTLSGGETFMAALALALGLADVVSGGSNRDLGALFVDEGFGSLDPQSLDAVIDVLRSLEDGGRIVGVISHVEELQQALPTGITVTASNAGSKAEVHYPPD